MHTAEPLADELAEGAADAGGIVGLEPVGPGGQPVSSSAANGSATANGTRTRSGTANGTAANGAATNGTTVNGTATANGSAPTGGSDDEAGRLHGNG
jgi:hypothetical protein